MIARVITRASMGEFVPMNFSRTLAWVVMKGILVKTAVKVSLKRTSSLLRATYSITYNSNCGPEFAGLELLSACPNKMIFKKKSENCKFVATKANYLMETSDQ